MSYNYLGLVNALNRKLNETELTSGNFQTSLGYYADAKDSVNRALRKIYSQEWDWPSTLVESSLTLVPNQSRYSYPADAKKIRLKSFRVVGDGTYSHRTSFLAPLDYEEYLQNYSDMEEQPEKYAALPETVSRAPSLEFVLAPAPDQAYTLKYEYHRIPPNLANWDDVPDLPEAFDSVIFDGAMSYMYQFKGDTENMNISYAMFKEGINDMRQLFSNRTEYVRSTALFR